jgi:subtilisin family serine protease
MVEDAEGTSVNGEASLAKTQTYAAVAVAILVIAAVTVALVIDRPDSEVDRSIWAFDMVQLQEAHRMGLRGEGVRVGIIDTGLDTDHPALKDVRVVGWRDLVNGRSEPYDDEGHGTAMASIIAGRDPLRGGAVGVTLIIAKAVDRTYKFSDEVIADAIDYCLDPDGDGDLEDGADIISLSLRGLYDDIELLIGTKTMDAINQALSHGVLVVAAVGNDPETEDVSALARIPQVISVSAVDRRGDMAPFSSPGNISVPRPDPHKKPELAAPGVDVVTAHLNGLYARGSGTSQATALTSAVLAAALSHNTELLHNGAEGGTAATVDLIKTRLMETARPLGWQELPHDAGPGYGLVQAVELAQALEE